MCVSLSPDSQVQLKRRVISRPDPEASPLPLLPSACPTAQDSLRPAPRSETHDSAGLRWQGTWDSHLAAGLGDAAGSLWGGLGTPMDRAPHPGPEKVLKYCQLLALGWQTFPEKSSPHRPTLDPTCLLLAAGPLLQGQRTCCTGVGKPACQAENLPRGGL